MKPHPEKPADSLSLPAGEGFPLDPLAGLAGLIVVTFSVVSYGKYDLLPLFPYFLFPLFLLSGVGERRARVLRRTLFLMPLAVLIGAANPFLDTIPRDLGLGVVLAGGWISLAGIIIRFLICVASALALTAAIPFADICRAARRMGLPSALMGILLFLWRYLSLLLEEGARLRRARAARAGGNPTWRSAAGIIGNLFLRTLDRAERIHGAMLARGFQGEVPALHERHLTREDWAFLALVGGAALGWRLLSPSFLPPPGVVL